MRHSFPPELVNAAHYPSLLIFRGSTTTTCVPLLDGLNLRTNNWMSFFWIEPTNKIMSTSSVISAIGLVIAPEPKVWLNHGPKPNDKHGHSYQHYWYQKQHAPFLKDIIIFICRSRARKPARASGPFLLISLNFDETSVKASSQEAGSKCHSV